MSLTRNLCPHGVALIYPCKDCYEARIKELEAEVKTLNDDYLRTYDGATTALTQQLEMLTECTCDEEGWANLGLCRGCKNKSLIENTRVRDE